MSKVPYKITSAIKTPWPKGPWSDEPDQVSWTDEATGLHCAILRMPFSGCLNGYVAVPDGHPLHGVRYMDAPDSLHRCHGGLTYSEASDDGLWWFGFDCCHSTDMSPNEEFNSYRDHVVYRDLAYVRQSVQALAKVCNTPVEELQ